jgi:hypothetical protein
MQWTSFISFASRGAGAMLRPMTAWIRRAVWMARCARRSERRTVREIAMLEWLLHGGLAH